jgi:futalosine hydrolase
MHILLVSATPFEIAPTLQWLESEFATPEQGLFSKNELTVRPLICGVGQTATAWQLGLRFAVEKPDWALNAGIAGAFAPDLEMGEVVNVVSECFADLGVEEADGRFTDLFKLGLAPVETALFDDAGRMRNPASEDMAFLRAVQGITVNKVHGFAPSIAAIRRLYPEAEVESMEGAAFFYACLHAGVPFLQIRGISNYVEPRNRDAWNLPLAIQNLNATLRDLIGSFAG